MSDVSAYLKIAANAATVFFALATPFCICLLYTSTRLRYLGSEAFLYRYCKPGKDDKEWLNK